MALELKLSELLPPVLEFGAPGEFTDPKTGLCDAGPFDLRFGAAHREQVKVGLVGPARCIQSAVKWLQRCRGYIRSKEENKARQYPDFPGFKRVFHASLLTDNRWMFPFEDHVNELDRMLGIKSPSRRFIEVLELYAAGVKRLSDLDIVRPDVVLCCISNSVLKSCSSVKIKLSEAEKVTVRRLRKDLASGQLSFFDELEETEEDLTHRDFRRALKAKAMSAQMPIQLGTRELFVDSNTNQDAATRAWNFSVALYYKAGGIPWRLKMDGPKTCFVGVSFHHLRTTKRHLVNSSIAQAFSSEGEGFALRGESIPWVRKQDRNVHLTEDQAFRLGRSILDEYHERTGDAPLRIVLHKTSVFNEAEERGFRQIFAPVPIVELVNILPTQFRLVRYGNYPPKRGTICIVNREATYLFLTGYMPELETYPGPHIPAPVQIRSRQPIDTRRMAADILGLARMNWNTASTTGGQPVTLSFSRRVGGIMAEFGDGPGLQSSFRYYI